MRPRPGRRCQEPAHQARLAGRLIDTGAFADALCAGPVILDGGLATELEARGHDLSGHLWSAALLAGDPSAIVATHVAYYRAGARVATTASYQASIQGFERAGMTRQESVELLRRSVDLAVAARTRVPSDDPLLVAASVGPYGATRGDGSEYTGDYDIGVAELRRFHRPRLEVLATAGADVLALETVAAVGGCCRVGPGDIAAVAALPLEENSAHG